MDRALDLPSDSAGGDVGIVGSQKEPTRQTTVLTKTHTGKLHGNYCSTTCSCNKKGSGDLGVRSDLGLLGHGSRYGLSETPVRNTGYGEREPQRPYSRNGRGIPTTDNDCSDIDEDWHVRSDFHRSRRRERKHNRMIMQSDILDEQHRCRPNAVIHVPRRVGDGMRGPSGYISVGHLMSTVEDEVPQDSCMQEQRGFMNNPVPPRAQRVYVKEVRSEKEWSVNQFDGKQDWSSYWAQFQMVAKFNRWTPDIQAMHLVKALCGTARTVLADMTPESMAHLPTLVKILERRYTPKEKVPAFRAQFYGRRQKLKENSQEFAEELRTLTLRAFPEENSESRESRMVDKFVDGLQDPDLKKHVMFGHPTSMVAAISLALEWEAVEEVQALNGAQKPKDQGRVCSANEDTWGQTMKTLADKIESLVQIFRATNNQTSRNSNRRKEVTSSPTNLRRECCQCYKIGHYSKDCPFKGVKCFSCHQMGHFSKECPNKK
jgi:hypothetical protein